MTNPDADARIAELERRLVDVLERLAQAESVVASLRNQPGFPTDGRKFSLRFPTLVVGPAGERYSVVRVAGGALSTVAAPAVTANWSNA